MTTRCVILFPGGLREKIIISEVSDFWGVGHLLKMNSKQSNQQNDFNSGIVNSKHQNVGENKGNGLN